MIHPGTSMSDYPSHHHTIPFPFPSIHFFRNKNRDRERQTSKHTKSKRWNWRGWLYQTTFGFWIALITVLLGGSAWGLSEQALRGGGTRWNIFLILAAYVALVRGIGLARDRTLSTIQDALARSVLIDSSSSR